MFHEEFYPTPPEVIEKMLEPFQGRVWKGGINGRYTGGLSLSDRSILEPSAGKGDILDYIDERCNYKTQMYCCELNPNLQTILQSKGYRVLSPDFLSYAGDHLFNLILMNPPFSNGDEHLLKAWEILYEGDIVCLLNVETVRNRHTRRRELLWTIIQEHGQMEYLGQVFQQSERKTDVEVVLIRLKKKKEHDRLNFSFENVTRETQHELDEETFQNQVATMDIVGNMILQYDETRKYFFEYLKVMDALHFYSEGLLDRMNIHEIIKESTDANRLFFYNKFTDKLKANIWSVLLGKTKVEKYMTHAVRQNFHEFAQHQGYMDFTKENVAALVEMIFMNRHTILDQAITEVFDIFTRYHEQNRCHVEGWKTNDAYKVNQKVILPHWVRYGEYMSAHDIREYGDKFGLNYSRQSEYTDIDKVMCYISGENFDKCHTIYAALDRKFTELGNVMSGSFDGTCESQFFHLRFFKKGTLHITFKDSSLWQEFNMRAAAGKNWLPDAEQKRYTNRPPMNQLNPQLNE